MYILAVDTTGPLCSVALLEKNKILAVRSSKEQKNHLKDLMPLIKDLLDSVQIHKSKLNYIAASIGPGSFTGIRIGVATARALAQVLDIPAVAVPTLDAFCCKPQARGRLWYNQCQKGTSIRHYRRIYAGTGMYADRRHRRDKKRDHPQRT